MLSKTAPVLIGCLFLAYHGVAGAIPVGTPTELAMGIMVPTDAGGAVPLGVGGIIDITALTVGKRQ